MLMQKISLALLVIFIKISRLSCHGTSSLAFVIDNTRSMEVHLPKVKQVADAIMDIMLDLKSSQINHFVLVTFNNPGFGLVKTANSRAEITPSLHSIRTDFQSFNLFCHEQALSGIEVALQASGQNSYLFVFTDASAQDYNKVIAVRNLAQLKKSQVMFLLTGDCGWNGDRLRVYYEIAAASGGIVFRIDKDDVQIVLNTIRETVRGEKNIITWNVKQHPWEYTNVPFTIAEKTDYAIVSSFGTTIIYYGQLEIAGPSTVSQSIMWTNNVKVVKLMNPPPGNYVAQVQGTMGTSVAVYATTDFTFKHGFSEIKPNIRTNSMSPQPTGGTQNHLSILVTSSELLVKIESAQIMDMDENVLAELALTKIDANFYTTEAFLAPVKSFRVAVKGTIIATGGPIRKISDIIIPQKPVDIITKMAPSVSVAEGSSVVVPYDGSRQLTCEVTSYPQPEIIWKNNNNEVQTSTSLIVKPPYKYTSYLKLNNFKNSGNYHCEAKNEIGQRFATVNVAIQEPFIIGPHLEGAMKVKYGDKATLHCDIKSSLPLQITWYKTDKYNKITQLSSSYKYSITSDGTALNIVIMDVDLVGKYTCKASLLSDETVKRTFSTDVNIYGLVVPVINKITSKMEINEDGSDTIRCIILEGVPKPKITWKYKNHEASIYGPINFNNMEIVDDVILVFNAELNNSGYFQCTAENSAGDDNHVTELVVTKKPVATIIEGNVKEVEYSSMLSLTCRVTASPAPKIVWKNNHGKEVNATKIFNGKFDFVSTIHIYDIKYSSKYYCIAENNQGRVAKDIAVTVASAFTVSSHPESVTITNYGNSVAIQCNIKSNLPIKITWYHMNNKTNEINVIHATTNTKNRTITTSTIGSDGYSISGDGTELKIKAIDLDQLGKYTCKASLVSEPDKEISFDTNVQIVGLVVPKIDKANPVIEISEGSPTLIECKASESIPMAQTSWEFQKYDSNKFQPISGSDDVLRIRNPTLDNAGYYRCVSMNVVGQDNKITELIVNKMPVITIVGEAKNTTVEYGGEVTLTCSVIAHPKPSIVWKDDKETVLPAKSGPAKNAYEHSSILKIASIKKSVKYNCEAKNNKGRASETVNVNVLSPFTVKEYPKEITNVEYGTEHTIHCSIYSSWPMKIDWFRILDKTTDEESVDKFETYSIMAKGTELKIRNMTQNLVGKYTCKASLLSDPIESKSFETNLKVKGLVVPEVSTLTTVTVEIETHAAIPCKVIKGNPKPKITWQFQSKSSDIFVLIEGSDEELQIAKVALKDSGLYKCVAKNIEGTDYGVTELIVEAPPKIISANNGEIYKAVEGDETLRIPCNITGYPNPDVTWSEDGKIISAGARYIIEDGALIIIQPVEKDSRNYTCEAKNRFGTVQKTFAGIVTPFPEDFGRIHYVYLRVGENKNIYCNSSDTDSIRWYSNEERKGSGSYLSLKNATVSMDGNYTCRVSNKNESHSETHVVDVGYPPHFLTDQDTPMVNWHGSEVLHCAADAKPDAKAEWVYNGKVVNTMADEFQFDIIGWGQYTCRISNVHDTIERRFTVTSTDCLVKRTTESVTTTPLLLTETSTWLQFDNNKEFMVIPSHENFQLMCNTGFKKFPKKTKIRVSCYHKDTFLVNGNLYKYPDLRCKDEVTPVVVKTGEKCLSENTETIKVGFNGTDFIEVYKVCFDTNNDIPLSTSLRMSGKKDLPNLGAPKWFKYPGIGDKKIDKEYTCLNSSASCCYAKNQLVNVQDVNFGPPQTSTFIDHLNAVPVWIPCGGSERIPWVNVEDIVRSQLDAYPEFDVFTGASKYVSKNGGLIPRYLWKVVRFFEEDSLAIVYVNDPTPSEDDILCENICSNGEQTWTNLSDKFTYCCDLEEFLTVFELPISIVGEKPILD